MADQKRRRRPTPINGTRMDRLPPYGGAPPPPDEPLTPEEELAERIWSERADANGYVDVTALDADYLTGLRAEAVAGNIPQGVLTTDPNVALYKINKQEVGQLLIRTRWRRGKLKARRFLPIISRDNTRPRSERRWADAQEDEAAAKNHAQARIAATAHTMAWHADSLVAFGASWEEAATYCRQELDRALASRQQTPLRGIAAV